MNSSGVLPVTSKPMSASRPRTSWRARAVSTSPWSLRSTAGGVFAGAINPFHRLETKPGKPDSSMVGTSGSTGERRAELTASARSFPSRASGTTMCSGLNIIVMRPLRRSGTADTTPL